MRITLISFDNWGFNQHIATALEKQGHIVHHIKFNEYYYKYPNCLYRIFNFFLKLFFKKNIKTIHYGKKIIDKLKKIKEKQDIILVIKGDFIDPKSVQKLKQYATRTIAYFNDSTLRCPKIIRVIPHFDEVYSFEKEDCEKYNLKFATNWIYNTAVEQKDKKLKYKVFNIISKDKRLSILSKIADDLKSKNISHKIFVFDKKIKQKTTSIEFITAHIPLHEINKYINDSQVLVDINRKKQSGLTFRVFESMGFEKKLITTNKYIKNYDFYNPNNILIIDEQNPNIPISFFESEYTKIPESILNKYTIEGWIKTVVFSNTK